MIRFCACVSFGPNDIMFFEIKRTYYFDFLFFYAYQKNFETSLLSYKQNTGNFFILLDAWDMLLMKQIEQLDKLNEALKLQAEYEYEIEKR